ncbi:MAG: hypothetical protein KF803_13715 [Cyclobacteriaceae bacterium]|nr:hypothetical protein [Cyclobacteriaceae bacterium]
MKTIILLVVVIVIGFVWINDKSTSTQPPDVTLIQAVYHPDHLHLSEPDQAHRYGNLQLYPIYASPQFLNYHRQLGSYLSLQEALNQKKLVITEIQGTEPSDQINRQNQLQQRSDEDQAEVNTLLIQNISADTIIILGGEVVRGGKQDRMIAQDFIILPHSDKIDISVFCVEHGRWNAEESVSFYMSMDVAPGKIRKAAKAAEPQEKVWEEVAVLHEDLDVKSSTGGLAYALYDKKLADSVEHYKKHLQKIVWSDNVVGVIAVNGNEIVGCDIFAQHKLFANYYPNLLSSYCSQVYKPATTAALPFVEVQTFLLSIIQGKHWKTVLHKTVPS